MAQTPMPAEAPKPKSKNMILAIIIIVILVVVGVGVYILTRPSSPTVTGVPVKIFDGVGGAGCATASQCGFNPSTITLKMGTNNTITWTNTGAIAHTVTSNATANGSLQSFNSNAINPNAQYTFTFPAAGTYYYYCSYHTWMKATVVVNA